MIYVKCEIEIVRVCNLLGEWTDAPGHEVQLDRHSSTERDYEISTRTDERLVMLTVIDKVHLKVVNKLILECFQEGSTSIPNLVKMES